MATTQPGQKLTQYPCHTQEEHEASFGIAPVSNFAGTTGDNAPDEPDDLVLGYGPIVPRWDVNHPGGKQLNYFVQVETFDSATQAKTAAEKFQKAADSWNELELGLEIVATTEQARANFYLVYKANPKVGPGRNTLARAFFPHEIDQDVIVFSKAFEENGLPILKNIFEHEIGHILGLRHEFAITGDQSKDLKPEGAGAVQFGNMNYNSIMSYNFPPKIQDSDREQTMEFYKLPNGHLVGRSPVTDYVPRIRSQNR